jgi:hypothetical protein
MRRAGSFTPVIGHRINPYEYRCEIKAVAERLMEVGCLDGSEACRIVESLRKKKDDI